MRGLNHHPFRGPLRIRHLATARGSPQNAIQHVFRRPIDIAEVERSRDECIGPQYRVADRSAAGFIWSSGTLFGHGVERRAGRARP